MLFSFSGTVRGAVSAITLSSMFLAGCASSSGDISAAYISPLVYNSYSCDQLAAEMQRIVARVRQVSGTVDENSTNDKIAMGVGLILFWPALFMLKGNGADQQELSELKGEYDAVNQAAIRNNCLAPSPAREVSPASTTVNASPTPSNLATRTASQVLGVDGSKITGSSTASVDMPDPHGVFVETIRARSPAAAAGLRHSDIILSFNGKRVEDLEDLNRDVSDNAIGSDVALSVWRDRKITTVDLRL